MFYIKNCETGKVYSLGYKNYWDAKRDCRSGEIVVGDRG